MEKTICFMSSVYRRPRRSPRDGQKSKRAEKASFILCGKKYPPRTLFESYFLRGAKTFKNWCVFNIFKKSFKHVSAEGIFLSLKMKLAFSASLLL